MPEAGQPVLFFSNTQLELAASGIQIFRKTAANLEAVPEYARGTLTANHIAKSTNEKAAARYPKRVAALLSFWVWMLS